MKQFITLALSYRFGFTRVETRNSEVSLALFLYTKR